MTKSHRPPNRYNQKFAASAGPETATFTVPDLKPPAGYPGEFLLQRPRPLVH
jgi:hypothetical protein